MHDKEVQIRALKFVLRLPNSESYHHFSEINDTLGNEHDNPIRPGLLLLQMPFPGKTTAEKILVCSLLLNYHLK